ncbi:MAG: hypothetical protein U0790_27275 [Isosphaeraceae bacterium]
MATTTVTTWCDEEGDPTAEGVEIGGIRITYAELEDITDREMAIDRGVTEDLIEMWEQQGGRDYAQLVDWLHRYAEECRQDQPLCDAPATERELADLIGENLRELYSYRVDSFVEAGVMSGNTGLVVRVGNHEFQVTVVRSR